MDGKGNTAGLVLAPDYNFHNTSSIAMAAIKAVTKCMERGIAPLRLAEKWDNVSSIPSYILCKQTYEQP